MLHTILGAEDVAPKRQLELMSFSNASDINVGWIRYLIYTLSRRDRSHEIFGNPEHQKILERMLKMLKKMERALTNFIKTQN